MKKTYTKTGSSCRVTFSLPAEVGAESVALCGDFNERDQEKHVLKCRKDGSFSTTISIKIWDRVSLPLLGGWRALGKRLGR